MKAEHDSALEVVAVEGSVGDIPGVYQGLGMAWMFLIMFLVIFHCLSAGSRIFRTLHAGALSRARSLG